MKHVNKIVIFVLIILLMSHNTVMSQDTLGIEDVYMEYSVNDSLSLAYSNKTNKLFTGYIIDTINNKNDTNFISKYENGFLIEVLIFNSSGRNKKYSFDKGIENGAYVEWDEKGDVIIEGTYKNGLKNGVWYFYDNRYKYCIGTYFNDMKQNRWKYFNFKGDLIKEEFYINDILQW
jgi:hypothetical protein